MILHALRIDPRGQPIEGTTTPLRVPADFSEPVVVGTYLVVRRDNAGLAVLEAAETFPVALTRSRLLRRAGVQCGILYSIEERS